MRATRALRNGSETARLQQETRQQQESLNALRAQMRQEKERRDAAPRGTRWGSASVKKGALGRSYGKDVRKRLEQRTAGGPGRAAAQRSDGRFWDLPVSK